MLFTQGRIRGPRQVHIIDDGRVACPVARRDVDIDRCYGCRFLADLADAPYGEFSYLVCAPRP